MDKRLKLDAIVCSILNIVEPDGDRHTYFDPPETIKMKYPAIRYSRKQIDNLYANNSIYKQMDAYELVLIDPNPDSPYIKEIMKLPYCTYDRHYKADNLNHDVFTIHI